MNEEEKQAIEFLKHSLYEYEEIDTSVLKYIDKNHKIIYKLILKQQKEIERKDKVFDDCKYTIIEYVKTAKDTMQKMEAMI